MIQCPTCGASNRDEATFCKMCRTPLGNTPPPAGAAPEPNTSAETVAEFEAQPTGDEQPVSAADAGGVERTSVELGAASAKDAEPAPGREAVEQKLEAAQELPTAVTSRSEAAATALALPASIAERYDLVEIMEQTPDTIVYRAYDRLSCGQCGTLRADLSDAFCWQCGAEIGRGALCRVGAGKGPTDVPQQDLVIDGGVTYWLVPEPIETVTSTPARQGWYLRVGYASDPGSVREIDEDSLLVVTALNVVEGAVRPSAGVFAVADGMGGHDNGQIASRRVVQVLAERLLPGLLSPLLSGETILDETFEAILRDAVVEANRRLTAEARANNSDMGSTLTIAFVHDGTAIIANIGDSRTYLWHDGSLRQITEDHSIVARLVATNVIQPDELYTHPRRNEIYRVMGDKPAVDIDTFQCELRPGDRLVLCCDGAWEMIRSEGIEEVLLTFPDDPQAACAEMVKRSNIAGGEDNISVIVVDVRQLPA